MRLPWSSLGFLLLPLLVACTGPKGDTGPMGPSGQTSPIYYYNNTFDAGGVGEWKTYRPAGDGSIQVYLDSTLYNSPGQSLAVSFTSTTGADALAYLDLPINPNRDCWVEFDWFMQGATAGGFEFFETRGGSHKRVAIGFDSTSLYLVQGMSHVPVQPQPSTGVWHHITIKVDAGTGLTNYWMDGMSLGSGYLADESVQGTPPSGYLMGIANQAGTDSGTHLDNLKCYHY